MPGLDYPSRALFVFPFTWTGPRASPSPPSRRRNRSSSSPKDGVWVPPPPAPRVPPSLLGRGSISAIFMGPPSLAPKYETDEKREKSFRGRARKREKKPRPSRAMPSGPRTFLAPAIAKFAGPAWPRLAFPTVIAPNIHHPHTNALSRPPAALSWPSANGTTMPHRSDPDGRT